MNDAKQRVIKLAKEMYEHTRPECGGPDCAPFKVGGCCAPEHCLVTREYAAENWGVELEVTDHPTLMFMGPEGCTVKPHLRPICTVHTCAINNLGFKKPRGGDSGMEWTDKYNELRGRWSEAMLAAGV